MSEYLLPESPNVSAAVGAAVRDDYGRFCEQGLPESIETHLLDRYGIDVSTTYAGYEIPNPWGKASGQLSMTAHQVQEDVDAGLGFVVLKTVIAQDETGTQTMRAWAIREARMLAEPIVGRSGETGWTISWKGRGWWQSFEEYLALVREAQRIARGSGTLIVPSCKFHLPQSADEPWKAAEYDFTTRHLLDAWRSEADSPDASMPLEKDFSPTLAGSDLAKQQAQILEWLRHVPQLVRAATEDSPNNGGAETPAVRLGLKLFNAMFDDAFQLEMLRAIHADAACRPDFFIYGNRLFDPEREFDGKKGIAYGGPDLSDRNLRIMSEFQRSIANGEITHPLEWSATGNIHSGKMALEYALRGASSFQLHTYFQLPAAEYRMKTGTKIQKALCELYFHPEHGLVVWLEHLSETLDLPRDPLRFRDTIAAATRLRR
ncbi:MAG: hypothetical protein WD066_17080 [Planctomycetaceae bacterium]